MTSSADLDLLDRITAEFSGRLRRGERPVVEEYAAAHPRLADEIRRLLVMVLKLEGCDPSAVPAASRQPHAPPRQIGGYRVIRELGRGGMGVVYEAEQPLLGRRVALKVLARGPADDAAGVARFRREAAVAAQLHHGNVVPVFEAGQDGDVCYFAMQYIDGDSLARLVQRGCSHGGQLCPPDNTLTPEQLAGREPPTGEFEVGPAPAPAAAAPVALDHRARAGLILQAARGLAYAHSRGMIHRDVKPGNLLLDSQGVVWVSDFGLVKVGESDLTATGSLVGTLRYMAPEQLRGQCDGRSDVYSLGLTLYELLALRPAFGGSSQEILEGVRAREPARPRSIDPSIPRDLETITLKATAKDPEARYQSADDFAEDLRRFLAGEPIRARRVGPVEYAWLVAKRHPAPASFFGLFLLALLATAGVSLFAARQSSRHADEMESALGESVVARRHSDLLAARLKFASALGQANEGSVDRALFDMVEALRLVPEGDEHEPFRRVLRVNLAAWSEQTARLRLAFRLPGEVPPGPYGEKDGHALRGVVAAPDSADRFVTVGPDMQIRQWSLPDGAEVGAPFVPEKEMPGSHPFSFSPDGRWLAVCGQQEGRLFDLGKGTVTDGGFRHPGRKKLSDTTYLTFTSDPDVLASTGLAPEDDGHLCFWDVTTKRKLPVQVDLSPTDGYSVAREEGGHALLFVCRQGQGAAPALEIWDLEDGKRRSPPLRLRGPHAAGVVCLPNREAARMPRRRGIDGPVCRWDPLTGRPAASPWQPPVSAWYRLLAADDSVLVTHCRDGRVRLFDLDAGRQLGGHVSVPDAYAPDNNWLSMGVAVQPRGGDVVTLSRDGAVRCWDVRPLIARSARALGKSPSHFPKAALGGEPVIALGGPWAFFGRGGTGRVVAVATGKASGPLGHEDLTSAQFSPDGRWLVTATVDYTRPVRPLVQLWEAATGELHHRYEAPTFVHGVCFSPDGARLAVGCGGQTLVLDVGRKEVTHALKQSSAARDLAFSPDGHVLAVGYRGGWPGVGAGCRLWDLRTGEPLGPFHPAWSWAAVAQPLGYAAAGDALVVLDPEGRRLTCLDPSRPEVPATRLDVQLPGRLATSPASALVAVTNGGGTIELWDVAAGERRQAIRSGCDVRSLFLSAKADVVAAACSDDAVRLWDVRTGLALGPPLWHPSAVAALAFGPAEGEVVVGTRSGQLFRWRLPAPMGGELRECERLLEARLGVRFDGEDAVLSSPESWPGGSRSAKER